MAEPRERDDTFEEGRGKFGGSADAYEQYLGSEFGRVQKGARPVDRTDGLDGSDVSPTQTRSVYRDNAVSDGVAESDTLGFGTYVSVLERFLKHEGTTGPLTVSVEGPWGSGKSTLMRLLARRLSRDDDAHVVWFNAWRHDEESSMWAAFMLEFLQQVSVGETTTERLTRSMRQLKYRVDSGEELLRLAITTALVVGLVVLFPTYVNAIGQSVLQSVFGAQSGLIAATSTAGSLAVSAAAVGWLLLQFRTRLVDPLERSFEQFSVEDAYGDRTSFIERFHSDFEQILRDYVGTGRVYVFVDDLDRCALPRAAELMQSINLMIGESENVYFVLGMDRDKVAASIAKRYEGLVPYLAAVEEGGEQTESEYYRGVWYGNRFIEKFVQVPLAVPRPTQQELRTFVESITGAADGESTDVDPPDRPEPDVLPEDRTELQAITRMVSPVLDDNPRRIKMFVNIFRLRKMVAHETGLLVTDDDSGGDGGVTPVQLGKFVAIGLRWPHLHRELERDDTLLTELYGYPESGEWDGLSPTVHQWVWNPTLMRLLFASIRDGEISYDPNELPPGASLRSVDLRSLLTVSPPLGHESAHADGELSLLSEILNDLADVGRVLETLLSAGVVRTSDVRELEEAERRLTSHAWESRNLFTTLPDQLSERLTLLASALGDIDEGDTDRTVAALRESLDQVYRVERMCVGLLDSRTTDSAAV